MKKLIIFVIIVLYVQPVFNQGTWVKIADFPGAYRYAAAGFTAYNSLYVGTGVANYDWDVFADLWEYNPFSDTWTKKADLPGLARQYAIGFSIGEKGYIGLGWHLEGGLDTPLTDFWEYDPATDTWTRKADFPGAGRNYPVAFSLNGLGYVGLGAILNDFYAFDPSTNSWSEIQSFPGTDRMYGSAFTANGKAYVGFGTTQMYVNTYKDLWEYDPASNSWTQKSEFPGFSRQSASSFTIGENGYVGLGFNKGDANATLSDFWKYNAATDTWVQVADYYRNNVFAVGLSAYGSGFIVLGENNYYNEFYRYDPEEISPPSSTTLAATNISFSAARLNARVNPHNDMTNVSFDYGATIAYGQSQAATPSPINGNTVLEVFSDITGLEENSIYHFRVVSSNSSGTTYGEDMLFQTIPSGLNENANVYNLMECFPNPFSDGLKIKFQIERDSHILLKLFDINGLEISTLIDGKMNKGSHEIFYQGSNLSSGIYILSLKTHSGISSYKIVCIRSK